MSNFRKILTQSKYVILFCVLNKFILSLLLWHLFIWHLFNDFCSFIENADGVVENQSDDELEEQGKTQDFFKQWFSV